MDGGYGMGYGVWGIGDGVLGFRGLGFRRGWGMGDGGWMGFSLGRGGGVWSYSLGGQRG